MPKRRSFKPQIIATLVLIAGVAAFFVWMYGKQTATPRFPVPWHSFAVTDEPPKVRVVPAQPEDRTSSPETPKAGLAGRFAYAGYPKGKECRILENRAYAVGYDEAKRNPLWSCYHLAGPPSGEKLKRPGKFKTDARTTARVTHDDYTRSGFDRGHLTPNFAIASRFGKEAQDETFLMSNIVPEAPALNQRLWKNLEERIAGDDGWAEEFREVWVTVGPVFDPDIQKLSSGVEIPDALYMIVLDVDEATGQPRVLAFRMPNTDDAETLGTDLARFMTSVDAVEGETDLDFFSDMEDAAEEAMKSRAAVVLWN